MSKEHESKRASHSYIGASNDDEKAVYTPAISSKSVQRLEEEVSNLTQTVSSLELKVDDLINGRR